MNKKAKWVAALTALTLASGGTALILSGCGEEDPGSSHTHTYTEWDSNDTDHWKVCPDDGEKDPSTVTGHTYTEWDSSMTQHWKYCPIDGKIDPAGKTKHSDADEDGKCPDCGYQIYTYITQKCKLVLRKDGANTAPESLEGITVELKQNGAALVEGTDYTLTKGEANELTLSGLVLGNYNVTVITADSEYRYSDSIRLDGSAEKELVLQYNYAIASSQAFYVDLTHMNDSDRYLAINASDVDNFWQWGAPVAEITLNLAEAVKESKAVKLEFNLKAGKTNNGPNNAFGIVMTETYKGISMSIWDTQNENDGVKLYRLFGQKLGGDGYSADGAATLKWIETALYGDSGVDIRVVRKDNTLLYFAKNESGKWVGIKSITCPADAKTEIKFMGAGSDFIIKNIDVDGEYTAEAQAFTATLSVLDAEGEKVTLAEGAKGLLMAGELRYEVTLDKNADGTYAFSGNFVPGLYSFGIVGNVNNYNSPAVDIEEASAAVTLRLGEYAQKTIYNPDWADGIQLGDCVIVADKKIVVEGNKAGPFWQWGTGNTVPAATLDLSDEIKLSKKVRVDFKLKASNANDQPNNSFGIALTEFHDGLNMSIWNIVNADDGVAYYKLKGTWLGNDEYHNENNTDHDKWLETAIYSAGANMRAERDGAALTFYARKDGEWVKIYETECDEYAETMVKFLAIGSDYEISNIKVRIPSADLVEYDVNASIDGESHGYSVSVDNATVERGDVVELTIETSNATAAWGYFPSAITVNGVAINFADVTRTSLGANRVRYTYTVEEVLENTNILVTVAKGTQVAYSATVADDTMGSVECDMEDAGKEYYWNDACTLTLTANEGYRLKSIVIGEGDDAVTVTEGWEKNGLVYSYTFTVTGDIDITVTYEATPTLDLSGAAITVVDKKGDAVTIAAGEKLVLSGDYDYELALTATDGGYTATGTVYEGVYSWYLSETELGYVSATLTVTAQTTVIELRLDNVATATKYHHGDYHDMGAIDFETLIEAGENTVKINTAEANGKKVDGFWCWNSPVPEAVLSVSDAVKNATDVQLVFNLKAAKPNDSPNNSFGIVMAAGYKGVNMSLWNTTNDVDGVLCRPLKGCLLANDEYGDDKANTDDWIEVLAYGESGVNIRAIRSGAKLKFFAENADGEWIKFFETTCADDAKTDIRFLGMGSDYTVSDISVTLPRAADAVALESTINDETFGTVEFDKTVYYVNDECIVTVTAEAMYLLDSLTVGGTKVECSFKDGVYTYSFIVTGDINVVATLKAKPAASVTFAVTAKDTDGTSPVTLTNGTQITFTNKADASVKYTYTVGGSDNPTAMAVGKYAVYLYGYAPASVEVTDAGGELAVALNKVIGYTEFSDVTVDSANGTVSITGNGIADREAHTTKNAEIVLPEGARGTEDITLTFTVKCTERKTSGSDWAAKRIGVQIGDGEIGFFLFFRIKADGYGGDNGVDVVKLNPGSLDVNPNDEKKWHGNDPDLAWIIDALIGSDGLQMKVERTDGVIHIYAKNGEDWVQLDTNGVSGENPTAGGDLTIGETVNNEIRLIGCGDSYLFSDITVTVNEADTQPE